MKTLVDIDHEMQSHEIILSGMHQRLMRGEAVVSPTQVESLTVLTPRAGGCHRLLRERGKQEDRGISR